MRSSRNLASVAFAVTIVCMLAGCQALEQQQPGSLAIRSARVVGTSDAPQLEIALDCRLSGPMQDALDHGIPLTLGVRIVAERSRWLPAAARAERRIELRYFPLSRRYQLRDVDAPSDLRTYATPGYLLAGLNSLRVPLPSSFASLPEGTSLRVGAALETDALPGALRLAAIFEPAWHLTAVDFAWHPAAG